MTVKGIVKPWAIQVSIGFEAKGSAYIARLDWKRSDRLAVFQGDGVLEGNHIVFGSYSVGIASRGM